MNHFEIIRRKVLLDGHSQREVAKELGHSRKTVAKALEHPDPPGYRMGVARVSPVMDRYRAQIEQWMESDRTAPPKQRHSAQRMFERLRDEHQFTGDEGTVRRFVARLKAQQPKEAFMPLLFEAGEEAQVDWGEAKVIENGTERTVQLFCMRLSHGKASFVYPYERATMEAFLDGHVRAFAFFGGVPKRLAYDNLKSAVTHVGRGKERQLNQRFVQLRSFYLFETRFCNIESGNEKGDVENLVKRSQRRYLTPVPEVVSIAGDLAEKLEADCRRDLLKVDDRQTLSRGELLEKERAAFLALPPAPFRACREEATHVSKQLLVRFDGNDYSAPTGQAHRPCVARGFVDRVVIEVDHQPVAVHRRSYGHGQFVLEPLHYLKLLERKPGSLDNARAFKPEHLDAGWGEELGSMRKELEYRQPGGVGTKQFIDILLLMLIHSMAAVKRAVGVCVDRRAYSAAAVENVLRNEPARAVLRLDLSARDELSGVGNGIRPLSIYDQLRAGGAELACCEFVEPVEAVEGTEGVLS
ncbi:MAG TPA: IS21 family transposase [Tepidisphaeraceae bacterium]|nr:IS21 family transposase [Tepidisphaeraceae bacterium]